MKVDGGCLCGHVRYEADVDPEKVGLCHCTDCQKLSGSPFVAYATATALRILAGQPKTYVKTAESGNRRAQVFCPDCGSRLWSTSEFDQKVFNLRIGTITQRAQLAPRKQVWCRSALPWVNAIGTLAGQQKN